MPKSTPRQKFFIPAGQHRRRSRQSHFSLSGAAASSFLVSARSRSALRF